MYSAALVTKPLYRKNITVPTAMDYWISKRTEARDLNTCNLDVQVMLVLPGIFFLSSMSYMEGMHYFLRNCAAVGNLFHKNSCYAFDSCANNEGP